jgi:hypothetical protein
MLLECPQPRRLPVWRCTGCFWKVDRSCSRHGRHSRVTAIELPIERRHALLGDLANASALDRLSRLRRPSSCVARSWARSRTPRATCSRSNRSGRPSRSTRRTPTEAALLLLEFECERRELNSEKQAPSNWRSHSLFRPSVQYPSGSSLLSIPLVSLIVRPDAPPSWRNGGEGHDGSKRQSVEALTRARATDFAPLERLRRLRHVRPLPIARHMGPADTRARRRQKSPQRQPIPRLALDQRTAATVRPHVVDASRLEDALSRGTVS